MCKFPFDQIKEMYPKFFLQEEVTEILRIELSILSHLHDLRKIKSQIDGRMQEAEEMGFTQNPKTSDDPIGPWDHAHASLRYVTRTIKNFEGTLKINGSPVAEKNDSKEYWPNIWINNRLKRLKTDA